MASGTLVSNVTTGAGLMAAGIAVCGFLAHARPALAGKPESELRRATVIGGLGGFVVALALIALSAVLG
jgi:hypothetical protein